MHEMLEKIDTIRKRTNVTYREAKEALERAGGDVVEALAQLEGKVEKCRLEARGRDLVRVLTDIIERGNASRIIVRNGERIVADIPVTVGAAAVILAPWAVLLGTMALFVSSWTVEIVRPART